MDYTQTNVLSMTGGTDFATIADLANYVDLTTNQTITSGIKTFTTLPQSSAVPSTGNQLVNKTYVDGAFVTLSTTQTISGAKTFSGNTRINSSRTLTFGTSGTGATLTFVTPGNMYYDNTVGGSHFFFISGLPNTYIDIDGVNIENGKYLYFNGKRMSITDNGTSLVTNVPTGNSHSFRINSVDKLTLHPTFGATFADNVNIQSDKYLNFSGGSFLLEESSFSNLIYNVPTANKHQFRVNNFDTVAISSDTNGTLFTFPDGTIMREYTSFNWFLYQLPSGHTLKYQVGGADIFEIQSGGAVLYEGLSMRNGKKVIWDEGFTNIAYLRKDTITNTFDYEVATGYKHKFMVNGVEVMSLSDGTYGLRTAGDIFIPPNKWIYMDTSNNGISCGSTGNMSYRAYSGTGNHFFFVGANEVCSVDINGLQMGVSTLPSNFPRIYTDYTQANNIVGDGASQIYTCGGTGIHSFRRGTGDIAYLDQLGLKLVVNNSALYLGATNLFTIQHDTGGTAGQFLIPSSWVYNFQVGGIGVAQIRSEGFYSFQNNTALRLGGTSQIEIKHDTATTQIQYKSVGSYNHMFYINGTLWYEMRTDTFRALRGYQNKLGATGAYVANNFNFSWSNPSAGALSVWIDTTRLGNMSIVSDYRLKENIVPARPVLERLCKIKMIEYEFKNVSIFKKNGISHGFIAHEVAELFPELINIIHGEKDALTDDGLIQPQSVGGELTNLYLSGIQELNAKCIAQQAQIDAQQTQMEAMQKQIDGLVLALSKIMSQ
jgi:hypothetical protein